MELETKQKTVALHTLGCRLNFSESGSIADGFEKRGFKIVPFGEVADVTFLNTCTVTDGADSTCRNLIRKANRVSPEGTLVVAGCYAQMEAEKISKMEGVDLILGTQEKYKVFEYLEEEKADIVRIDQSNEFWGSATTLADYHTRAFLKIQDGCNYICSFCIIPFARGRSRVITIEDALNQAKSLVSSGFKEIVLTGVNIGEYEARGGERLEDLISQMVEIKGLERLRMSSVEPNTITESLLKVMKGSQKFLEHFHIPMQSGDDLILKEMRRKYDVLQYQDTIAMIKDYFPTAGIGADMIVGFPGESEEQFANTFEMASSLPITHFHVFPYSRRQKTTAAKLDNHIQYPVKKNRLDRLVTLGEEKLTAFAKSQIGTRNQVLFESEEQPGFFTGYTRNFLKVTVQGENLKNTVRDVTLTDYKNQLVGELLH